jgi:hypothetical protein
MVKKDTCKLCGMEIELAIIKGKRKWIHSPFQKGKPISLTEAEELAEHDAIPK